MNIFPYFKINNFLNVWLACFEHFGNFPLGFNSFIQKSYFSYLRFFKFSHPMIFPARATAFCNFIIHIIFVSSKKQMLWPNAKLVIATVENEKKIWNISIVNHPRSPIGFFHFPIHPKSSISMTEPACRPIPTSISFFDLIKKPFDYLRRVCETNFRFIHSSVMFGFSHFRSLKHFGDGVFIITPKSRGVK